MADHFRLYLETTEATAPLIAILRRHTGKSMSDLRQAITTRQPILDERPHQNQYSMFIETFTKLLNDLESDGIPYRIEVDGSPESHQYVRNVFQRWNEIGQHNRWMDDLQSGKPCIETLEWLKNSFPTDVFRQTLKQIIDRDGYACDEKIEAWARRELKGSEQGTVPDEGA